MLIKATLATPGGLFMTLLRPLHSSSVCSCCRKWVNFCYFGVCLEKILVSRRPSGKSANVVDFCQCNDIDVKMKNHANKEIVSAEALTASCTREAPMSQCRHQPRRPCLHVNGKLIIINPRPRFPASTRSDCTFNPTTRIISSCKNNSILPGSSGDPRELQWTLCHARSSISISIKINWPKSGVKNCDSDLHKALKTRTGID